MVLHLLMNLFSKCLVSSPEFVWAFLKYNFVCLFIYLFFGCARSSLLCVGFSLVGASGGSFLVVMCRLFVVASLVAAHRLESVWASVAVVCALSSCGCWTLEPRLSSCGLWAQLLHGMWDPPSPGIELTSPALAGGFLTTEPPGKCPIASFLFCFGFFFFFYCPPQSTLCQLNKKENMTALLS